MEMKPSLKHLRAVLLTRPGLATAEEWLATRLARRLFNSLDIKQGRFVGMFGDATLGELLSELIKDSGIDAEGYTDWICSNWADLRQYWLPGEIHCLSRTQVRKALLEQELAHRLLEERLLDAPNVSAHLVWKSLAKLLAAEAHLSWNSRTPTEETYYLSILGLANYFQHCRLLKLASVVDILEKYGQGLNGVCGGFLSLPYQLSSTGILDVALPPVKVVLNKLPSGIGSVSLLVDTALKESQDFSLNNGAFSRVLGPYRSPLDKAAFQYAKLPDLDFYIVRSCFDAQYTTPILAYLSISAIEQLLRSAAEDMRIAHIDKNGIPVPVGKWFSQLQLDESLEKRLEHLFKSDKANIRNRAMHCGLLNPGPAAYESYLHVLDSKLTCLRSPSPESPENVAAYCEQVLQDLLFEMHSKSIPFMNGQWAASMELTYEEVKLGRSLVPDILIGPTEFSAWYIRVCHYIFVTLPCMGELPQLLIKNFLSGINASSRPNTQNLLHDGFIVFLFWGLLFEALFRVTARLHGFSILEVSRSTNFSIHCRYKMLERRHLLREDVLDALVECVEPSQRSMAKQSLAIVIKLRNAMSHGALYKYSEEDHFVFNNLFFKSVQLLVDSGIHAMTKVNAYYRWQTSREYNYGFDLEDYFISRAEVFDMLERFGDLQKYMEVYRFGHEEKGDR